MFVELGDSERDFILFQDRAILQCELINSTCVPQRQKKYEDDRLVHDHHSCYARSVVITCPV
jgi:hypothetical protein